MFTVKVLTASSGLSQAYVPTVYPPFHRRYITNEQRKSEDFSITEDDIQEVRQDIRSFISQSLLHSAQYLTWQLIQVRVAGHPEEECDGGAGQQEGGRNTRQEEQEYGETDTEGLPDQQDRGQTNIIF